MNKKLLKVGAVGYVGCMPFLTLSQVFVVIGMLFGILLTICITVEVNKARK